MYREVYSSLGRFEMPLSFHEAKGLCPCCNHQFYQYAILTMLRDGDRETCEEDLYVAYFLFHHGPFRGCPGNYMCKTEHVDGILLHTDMMEPRDAKESELVDTLTCMTPFTPRRHRQQGVEKFELHCKDAAVAGK